jgi:cell division protein FtsQ
LVDADDVAFRTVATPPVGLVRLDVPGGDDRSDAAAQVAGTLPAALAGKLTSITAPTPESVTLHLSDGRTVLWGGTDRSADKARLLAVLIGRPGSYFDLSDPSEVLSRGSTDSK